MSPTVVLDADFLSAFLKIEQLPLVRQFHQVEALLIPLAVYREIALTSLLPSLLACPWIAVATPEPAQLEALASQAAFNRLGAGEQGAIALARQHLDSVLLTNDSQAIHTAAVLGVTAVNIPAFLLACKLAGLLNPPAMEQVVAALQAKDHYGFRQDVLALLLA